MAHVWELGNACTFLVGKYEQQVPFVRPRCGRAYTIKTDLTETYCEIVDWTDLNQDRNQ
jgi:hypothetical protein